MSYHITSSGEVDQCSAQIKCRLGGPTGKENHFATRAEAVAEVERRNGATRDPFTKLKKATTTSTLKALRDSGMAVRRVKSVASHDFGQGDMDDSSVDVLDGDLPVALKRKLGRGETITVS